MPYITDTLNLIGLWFLGSAFALTVCFIGLLIVDNDQYWSRYDTCIHNRIEMDHFSGSYKDAWDYYHDYCDEVAS